MKTNGSRTLIIAVTFVILLIVGSGAQASGLFAFDGNPAAAERQSGLFQQAVQWLSGTWNELATVFAFTEEAPPLPLDTTTCTTNCGDAGAGIDPEG